MCFGTLVTKQVIGESSTVKHPTEVASPAFSLLIVCAWDECTLLLFMACGLAETKESLC